MKKNIGSADKIIRIIVAIIFVILYFTNVVSGILGIILLVLAAIFVVVSLIGNCPLYIPLGINNSKKENTAEK